VFGRCPALDGVVGLERNGTTRGERPPRGTGVVFIMKNGWFYGGFMMDDGSSLVVCDELFWWFMVVTLELNGKQLGLPLHPKL